MNIRFMERDKINYLFNNITRFVLVKEQGYNSLYDLRELLEIAKQFLKLSFGNSTNYSGYYVS